MSRSIHTTRRDLKELEASDYATAARRKWKLRRVQAQLERKRLVKAAVRRERTRGPASHTSVDTIPVVVRGDGAYVHHAATAHDVREVLRRLPPGVLDGLTRIELQLGVEEQREWERDTRWGAEPDPLIGRTGFEHFPGVFSGRVLGVYLDRAAIVHVNAYVCRADTPLGEVWRPLLRMEALSVLVHELGHHYDDTMRVARGRWLALPGRHAERFAEDRQACWTRSAVVPYLRAAYPEEMDRLESWVERHGTVRLSLETIADRTYLICGLAKDVARGAPPHDRLVAFARALAHDDLSGDALRCLAAVLSDDRWHFGALTLYAEILQDLGRHAVAILFAARVLARDARNVEAWDVTADAWEALGFGPHLRTVADRVIAREPPTGWERAQSLLQRAQAALSADDVDAARADAERLALESADGFTRFLLACLRMELALHDTVTIDEAHHP